MSFIKNNKYILAIVLGIVSVALLIPSITDVIDIMRARIEYGVEVPARYYFDLVKYICIFFAEIIFIIIGVRRTLEKYLIAGAAILYYASMSATIIYGIAVDGDYSSIFNLLIEVLCLVATILAITRPQYLFGAIVVILIDLAFNLSKTFGGSTLGFSVLILDILLIFALYLSCRTNSLNEVDYDQYS